MSRTGVAQNPAEISSADLSLESRGLVDHLSLSLLRALWLERALLHIVQLEYDCHSGMLGSAVGSCVACTGQLKLHG